MQNIRIVKRPEYAIDSVDKALQLITLLQEREWVRIADAARELGVAPSTAHRLMSTLAYRGFALQDDQRRYCAGPVLAGDAGRARIRALVARTRPHLEALAAESRETVNLVERVGVTVRFLHCVEGPQLLRVGNRTGTILPARTSSGGRAALAALPQATVDQLYTGRGAQLGGHRLEPAELAELHEELATTRARGYSLNLGRTEPEIAAMGAAVALPQRPGVLAVTLSAPISRAPLLEQPDTVAALRRAAEAIGRELEHEPSF
ncbi:transcriptional regulator [Sinomonas cellulolyticus]|uniref:IclR family transcriptional regulator n=1 Tax=Sinomonas cellulolyticus TaxID=2801916 RepID=A0ABS1K2M2_9MICC|nr:MULTISPECIES: IclR family transcriptional regulator [Sinomonas]MBL0705562.1 IclR family transcriptional regulator [Sinomonas cellulolyticus]GHG51349.1 transcriptional regulator [Sinomonas sp. KCTC 49339]